MDEADENDVGVVVIGRNEGERLRRCLSSVVAAGREGIVYVDSGSTDGSRDLAAAMGVEVVALDTRVPFTAARARNAGLERLRAVSPGTRFVQFIDGDCEMAAGWIDAAMKTMDERPDATIVCGRLRERFPEASVYNRICDIEWDTPVGEVAACGGIFLARRAALEEVSGFDPSVIAAEDDELCVRLRLKGGKVLRIDHDMAHHDAAMTRLGQWFRRAKRAGYAYGQVGAMHGRSPARHFVRQTRGLLFWAIAWPVVVVAVAVTFTPWALAGLALYLLPLVRSYTHTRNRGQSPAHAMVYALHCVAAKFPQALGLMKYHSDRLMRRQGRIIEHKDAAQPALTGGNGR